MKDSRFTWQHPVLSYYILTFAISWGGIVAIVGPHGFPGNPANLMKMLPSLLLAMLAGPIVATISVTGLAGGKAGYREFFASWTKWRAGIGGYAAALLTAPLVFAVLPLAMAFWFRGFVPHIFTESNKGFILVMGMAVGAIAGIFEETGWTGFVIPRLRLGFNTVTTGAIVGFLWAAWHLPVNIWSSGTSAKTLSIPNLVGTLLFSFGVLPAFRVLMVFVWDRTASVPVAMLMHATLTASNIILAPTSVPGLMGIAYHLSITAALWTLVGICAAASPERRTVPAVHA